MGIGDWGGGSGDWLSTALRLRAPLGAGSLKRDPGCLTHRSAVQTFWLDRRSSECLLVAARGLDACRCSALPWKRPVCLGGLPTWQPGNVMAYATVTSHLKNAAAFARAQPLRRCHHIVNLGLQIHAESNGAAGQGRGRTRGALHVSRIRGLSSHACVAASCSRIFVCAGRGRPRQCPGRHQPGLRRWRQ
ncbi:hypothetical protein XapB_06140 [Xanthomonas citri pv. punicae]|nr:hypothetical protein XapB_06140 [Xanthomonas citri pv. punicae]QCZ88916.1 hypothetical protein DOO79_06840 [Xanthomonas citri pv. punicae]